MSSRSSEEPASSAQPRPKKSLKNKNSGPEQGVPKKPKSTASVEAKVDLRFWAKNRAIPVANNAPLLVKYYEKRNLKVFPLSCSNQHPFAASERWRAFNDYVGSCQTKHLTIGWFHGDMRELYHDPAVRDPLGKAGMSIKHVGFDLGVAYSADAARNYLATKTLAGLIDEQVKPDEYGAYLPPMFDSIWVQDIYGYGEKLMDLIYDMCTITTTVYVLCRQFPGDAGWDERYDDEVPPESVWFRRNGMIYSTPHENATGYPCHPDTSYLQARQYKVAKYDRWLSINDVSRYGPYHLYRIRRAVPEAVGTTEVVAIPSMIIRKTLSECDRKWWVPERVDRLVVTVTNVVSKLFGKEDRDFWIYNPAFEALAPTWGLLNPAGNTVDRAISAVQNFMREQGVTSILQRRFVGVDELSAGRIVSDTAMAVVYHGRKSRSDVLYSMRMLNLPHEKKMLEARMLTILPNKPWSTATKMLLSVLLLWFGRPFIDSLLVRAVNLMKNAYSKVESVLPKLAVSLYRPLVLREIQSFVVDLASGIWFKIRARALKGLQGGLRWTFTGYLVPDVLLEEWLHQCGAMSALLCALECLREMRGRSKRGACFVVLFRSLGHLVLYLIRSRSRLAAAILHIWFDYSLQISDKHLTDCEVWLRYLEERSLDDNFAEIGWLNLTPLTTLPGTVSKIRGPPAEIRGEFSIKLKEQIGFLPKTHEEVFDCLDSTFGVRRPNAIYPLLWTNGGMHMPAKNSSELHENALSMNLWVGVCHRILRDPFTEVDSQEIRDRRWDEFRFVLRTEGFWNNWPETEQHSSKDAFKLMGARGKRLDVADSALQAGHVPTSYKAYTLKANETIPLKDTSYYRHGVKYNVRTIVPRTITNISPDKLSAVAAVGRYLSARMKKRFDGTPFQFCGFTISIYYVCGYNADDLSALGSVMAQGGNVLLQSGDDQVCSFNIGPHAGKIIEADAAKCDHTQDANTLIKLDTEWMEQMSVPPEFIEVLISCCVDAGNARLGLLVAFVIAALQQATGTVITTCGTTLHCLCVWLYYFYCLSRNTPKTLAKCASNLGFTFKIKEHASFEGKATFLRGWWLPALSGKVRWYPLPSCVLKLGKILSDPGKQFPKMPLVDAYMSTMAGIIKSVSALPAGGYPIVSEFAEVMLRGGQTAVDLDKEATDSAGYKWAIEDSEFRPQLRSFETHESLSMVVLDYMCERYDITVAEIEETRSLILSIRGPPPYFVSHPVFLRLRDVDYA